MAGPKVNIITFVYCDKSNKRLPLLKECMDSIKNQKFVPYKHIIVDDGSPIDVASAIQSYPRVNYYKLPRTGITHSTKVFNYGLLKSTADYIMYLASDDKQCPGAMRKLSTYLDEHPDKGMVVGSARCVYLNGKSIIYNHHRKSPLAQNLKKGNVVNGCCVMFRRSLLDKIELPPDEYGFVSDYGLWCELSAVADWGIIDDVVVEYRQVADSTRNKTKKNKEYKKSLLDRVKQRSIPKIP